MNWTHKGLLALSPQKDTFFANPIRGLRLRVCPTSNGFSRTWDFRRMVKGKIYKTVFGPFPDLNMATVQQMALEANSQIALGNDPFETPESDQRVTVREAYYQYIEARIKAGKKIGKIKAAGERDLVRLLGDKPVAEVKPLDVQTVFDAPVGRGLGVCGGRAGANGLLRIMKAFFQWCEDFEIDGLDRSPAKRIKLMKVARGKPARVLTMREMAVVILAARDFDVDRGNTNWADIIYLLCALGSRKAEIIEMPATEWDSFKKVWRLPAARYKTAVDQSLPVGPKVAKIFDRLSQDAMAAGSSFMIPAQFAVRRGNDTRAILEIQKFVSQPVERFTLHSTRYSFRSNIRKMKIADSELAERIIHPKAQGAFSEHYDPDMFDEIKEALTAWEERLDEEIASVMSERLKAVA